MIAGMFATLLLLMTPPPDALPWGGMDFVQYFVAAELLTAGQNPYDRALAEARQKQLGRESGVATFAPPWALLVAMPLSKLPLQQATLVNIVLNVLLLVLCAMAWARLLFPDRPRYAVVLLVALPVWMPCLAVVGIGQYSLWPLAGFTGWLWFTTKQRHLPAAIILVLTVIKPHLGLLPGLFVAGRWMGRRQFAPVAAFVASLIVLTLLTLWLRPTIWMDYVAGLQAGITPGDIQSATLDGWGRANFGQSFRYVTWTIWAAALLGAFAIGWRTARADDQKLVAWSAIVCTTAVATVPYAFSFDFVFLLPGFLLAVGRMVDGARHWRLGLAAWLGLELWMVAGKLAPWDEAAYWFVPWIGLGVTAWLVSVHRTSTLRPMS
jgi:hypothetical protein